MVESVAEEFIGKANTPAKRRKAAEDVVFNIMVDQVCVLAFQFAIARYVALYTTAPTTSALLTKSQHATSQRPKHRYSRNDSPGISDVARTLDSK